MTDDVTPRTRYLSGTERIFLAGRLPAICILELEGALRADVLEQALDALASEHPILRSRVSKDDVGLLLQRLDRRPELIVRTDVDDPALTEANSALDVDQANARFTLYLQGGNSTLALVLSHAFSDGLLLSALSHRLLSYYAVLASGQSLSLTPSEQFEEPLESRLPPNQALVPFTKQPVPPITLPAEARDQGAKGAGVYSLRFDKTSTDAVLAKAAKAELSPLGLISGCAATAIFAERSADDQNIVAIWCLLDLRSRLPEKVAPTAGIFCAAPAVLTLHIEGQPDPAKLGRQAVTQLKTAMEEGIPERMVATLAQARPDEHPKCSITISNVGRYLAPALPAGLTLLAHRGFVVSDSPAPTVIVITTGDRLCIDITYNRALFTHEQMVRWATRMRSELLGGSESART